MIDTLEWALWLRAIWDDKKTLALWVGYQEGLEALDFFNLWVDDLLHIGRVYDDAP